MCSIFYAIMTISNLSTFVWRDFSIQRISMNAIATIQTAWRGCYPRRVRLQHLSIPRLERWLTCGILFAFPLWAIALSFRAMFTVLVEIVTLRFSLWRHQILRGCYFFSQRITARVAWSIEVKQDATFPSTIYPRLHDTNTVGLIFSVIIANFDK